MNGAEAILNAFEQHHIDTVFGYPGGCIMPLYDALVSRNVKAFGPAGDGPHLIQQQIDFQNPRQRLVTLTPEGHKILKMLHEVIAGTKKAPELPPVLDKRKLGQ